MSNRYSMNGKFLFIEIYTTGWYSWSIGKMNKKQINRREFFKKLAEYVACATFGITGPAMFQRNAVAGQNMDIDALNELLQAVEASDVDTASEQFRKILAAGGDAWQIHLSLFPMVQRILNPPYINPHLPKMYAVCRELVSYLNKDEIAALVHIEVVESASRPKLQQLSKTKLLASPVSFNDVTSAIGSQDWQKTAVLMATFRSQKGGLELARRLLLLGSGYLDRSLGHSISCTAFILLEMLKREDQDPWPALVILSDYFCKGGFDTPPNLNKQTAFTSEEIFDDHLLQATSGQGIVNLHHTITVYALERVRQFFSQEEYQFMIGAWIAFMQGKKAGQIMLESRKTKPVADYDEFYKTFSKLDAQSVMVSAAGMMNSQQSRQQLGYFLTRGLCDRYQGDYNPHNITGLGSALWVIDRYWHQPRVVQNALFQYLDFFFDDIKSKR